MKKQISIITAFALVLGLTACGKNQQKNTGKSQINAEQQVFKWKLVTSWPKNYPGLGTAPERFAKDVEAMSNGRLKIKVYGAGELVPCI